MEILPQRHYSRDFTMETLLQRVYHRDFTTETLPQRLYHGDFTMETFGRVLGKKSGFYRLLSANYLIGSGGEVFSILVYHWLPLATIAVVGGNREFES